MSATPLQKPLKLGTIGDQVLNHIRNQILSGELATGTRIDQNAIASELGVSIIPVRESLRQLEAEGLIEKRPYRGAFVAELSLTELLDIYAIREELEELAAQLAVKRMTPETLTNLNALIVERERHTLPDNRRVVGALDGLSPPLHLHARARRSIAG